MKHIRIGCYSDIHHHEYSNGITGADVEAVEDEFLALCIKEKVDLWVFGGDRFLSRNPLDISRRRADAALKRKSESGIRGIIELGNHDRWTKNPHSGHNLYHISMYPQELGRITVMDTIMTHKELVGDTLVSFHSIPAGHKAYDAKFNINKEGYNVCLFHDIVKGCRYTNGVIAPEGVGPEHLDRAEFDIVLGGDNHQPQDLYFKNTFGMYMGAPMQHNWGDIGSDRGYWIIDLWEENGKTRVLTNFHRSSAPKFIKEDVELKSDDDLTNFIKNIGTRWQNNIVRVTFSGKPEVLAGIQISKLSEKLKLTSKARSVKSAIQYNELINVLPESIAIATTPDQEWREYINYKSSDFAGLDLNRVEQIGLEYIIEADNE